MERISEQAIRSCCDCVEYFLRYTVLVSPGDKRMENRNGGGGQGVNKRGSSSGPRGTGSAARPGGTAGERCHQAFFARSVVHYARGAHHGGRKRVIDAQQVIPSARPAGR